MKDQARYDLNAAVETWRQELASESHFTPNDLRELEAHLRDTIMELRDRGLNEEESFWLARHRLGRPRQIAGEFVKGNPAGIWRERMFGMAVVLLIFRLWSDASWLLVGFVQVIVRNFPWIDPPWAWNYTWLPRSIPWQAAHVFVNYAPLLYLAVSISKGRITQSASWAGSIFSSRLRFILVSATILAACYSLRLAAFLPNFSQMDSSGRHFVMVQFLLPSIWEFSLIAIIAWLMPAKQAFKTAEPA